MISRKSTVCLAVVSSSVPGGIVYALIVQLAQFMNDGVCLLLKRAGVLSAAVIEREPVLFLL